MLGCFWKIIDNLIILNKGKFMLDNKNILIGITGGIAAYKICELIRLLKRNNANVKVVLSENALNFVTKTTIQTLTQNKVYMEEFGTDWSPEHISLANWADIFVVAPATANTIGKIANGIYDNLLTSVACAFNKKVLIVPAMNCNMWNNDFVQKNISALKQSSNIDFVGPNVGFLACNINGVGKMSEPQEIFEKIKDSLIENSFLRNNKIIVTAGGTKEAIDPIRCISNYSSGKMGIAMADEAYKAGADVILITTVNVERPYRVVIVDSTIDILNSIKENLQDDSNLIMTASVSDFRPEIVAENKIKKNMDEGLIIKLVQNPDILKEISKIRNNKQKIIGFCAETENLVENALKKIKSKNLDYIVANDVSRKDIGFNVDYNEVILIDKNENQYKIERNTKHNIAKKILQHIFK